MRVVFEDWSNESLHPESGLLIPTGYIRDLGQKKVNKWANNSTEACVSTRHKSQASKVVISKVEHKDFFTSTRTTKQKYFIVFIKEINKPSHL